MLWKSVVYVKFLENNTTVKSCQEKFYYAIILNGLYTKELFICKIEGMFFAINVYHKFLGYTDHVLCLLHPGSWELLDD